MRAAIKGIILTCLFLAYPYLIYQGMEKNLVWISPAIFSAIFLQQSFLAKKVGVKITKALFAIALLFGAYYLQSLTAKLLPVLFQLILMYFFGRTLLKKNSPPLIERFVRLQFPDSPPEIIRYCGRLTLMWTLFFAMNAIVVTILVVLKNDFWWSLYNGVLIYLIMGLLVLGEYIYRRIRFTNLKHGIPDPLNSMKTMIVNGRKIWMDLQVR